MRRYGKARRAATSSSYQTGDLLRRDLSWYADHYGVYLGRYQGQEWVIEVTRLADQPARATIRTVPLQLFADGKRCTLIERGTADPAVIRRRVDELRLELRIGRALHRDRPAPHAQGEAIDKAARVGKASLLAAAGVLGAGLIGMGVTYLKHRRKLPSAPQ